MSASSSSEPEQSGPQRILYCRCAYSKVVPAPVKDAVLAGLAASDVSFDAVADLCEMSARRDPALTQLSGAQSSGVQPSNGGLRIAACYPRAVRWLFHAAGAPLPENDVEIANMREDSAEDVLEQLLAKSRSGQRQETP